MEDLEGEIEKEVECVCGGGDWAPLYFLPFPHILVWQVLEIQRTELLSHHVPNKLRVPGQETPLPL